MTSRRPAIRRHGGQPPYYLGRPADRWIEALAAGRRPPSSRPAVAVVTGDGGLGRLVAEGLAAGGFAVGLMARSGGELEESATRIEAAGGTALAAVADVGDGRAVAPALGKIRRRLGPVEVLVNDAGAPGLRGPLIGQVLPEMAARGRGRIVNVTSRAGAFRWPGLSAYSASTAAVVRLTDELGRATRCRGVSVFSVHLGPLPTDSARAVDLVVRLASGRYDDLPGRHLSVDADPALDPAGGP
ncbi:MAG TPA: SDR family NAD(P)-dependent oxidoreductase [Acidimicrobiales bacterium]|nr:SDR family NAD(P)-dependent oxidoreductase [Acidimicrobiales bacterium]